jgi:FkbM family methyltransferase
MQNIQRPAPFVLISTNHGTMIINRNDYRLIDNGRGYGVGYQLMTQSAFDPQEVNFAMALLTTRHKNFGAGVVAIDCGANIGVHTVEWARLMHQWGRVISFEAQEKIYYALAGNVAINNCLNVTARWAAVGAECGTLEIPEPNYLVPSSYGSFEIKKRDNTEYIGQEIDYTGGGLKSVDVVTIDSLRLERLDFIKIDVEGMELEVLQGARETIVKYHPQMMIEVIKSDQEGIRQLLSSQVYRLYPMGINMLAVHQDDPVLEKIKFENGTLSLNV